MPTDVPTVPSATLEGFSYCYPAWSDAQVPVLRDVDLVLGPGITLVAGDSGAGKSTLLRVLNGLVPHFHGGRVAGRATVCGMDVLSTPTRRLARHVGFVFQEPELGFVRGSVAREVAFGPENLGVAPPAILRQVADALDRAGIADLATRRIRSLSGGERQRVALAAVLAAMPQVVVMDEPMSQLDEDGAAMLGSTVEALARGGCTVVVAEHRLGRFPDGARIVSMAGGELSEGRPTATAQQLPGIAPGAGRDAGGATAWALEGVVAGIEDRALVTDLHVAGAAGEIVLVTGPNGSGKTTLLRTIAGLLPPLAGRVERGPGRVAYLPQEPGVLLHRNSVRAEVEQTLRWTGSPAGPEGILELFALGDLAGHDPRDLSVGQRQRAALATVLAGRPRLALLDEPTRGMDASARRALAAALVRLAEGGTAVVLATHDVELAGELPGRRLEIARGLLRPAAVPVAR